MSKVNIVKSDLLSFAKVGESQKPKSVEEASSLFSIRGDDGDVWVL